MNFKRIIEIVSIGIFIFVLWKFFQMPIDWGVFYKIEIATLSIIVIGMIIVRIIWILQWKIMQDKLSKVSFKDSILISFSTLYLLYFPLRVGQFLMRMYLFKERGIPYKDSGASLFAQFILAFVFMSLTLPLLIFFIPTEYIQSFISNNFKFLILMFILVVVVIALLKIRKGLHNLFDNLLTKLLNKSASNEAIKRNFRELRDNVKYLMFNKKLLIKVNIFFVIGYLIYFYLMSLLWNDMGHDISFILLMLIFFVSYVIGFISQVPNGLGTQETSYAYLLSLVGISFEIALIVAPER